MLRVTNIVQDFNMGGIQSVLLSLLREFKDDSDVDYSVVVLESARGSEFDRIAASEGLNVTYLGCRPSSCRFHSIRKMMRDLSYDGRLFLYLLRQKPQVVHTHNTRMLTLILKCIKWTRKRFVWIHTLHSDPYAVHEGHIPRIQTAVFDYGVYPVCLNETQFQKARERYGLERCHYLYNMVELDKFHGTLATREKCRDLLDIPQDAYVIGTVGRLDPVKNYRFLIKAFALVVSKSERALLVFAGDGEEADTLRQDACDFGVADRVRFLGIREDIERVYPSFDVFVSTSTTEASSLVVLEAQATGLSCVVSAACPKESVISDRVVRMPEEATVEDWAMQLLDPSGFAIPCATEEDYSAEAVKRSLKELYGRLTVNRL